MGAIVVAAENDGMLTASLRKQWDLQGEWRESCSLKKYNTWGFSGQAAYAYWPKDLADCQRFYAWWKAHYPAKLIRFLGLGSNVLIPDEGIDGVIVFTQKGLTAYQQEGDHVICESGMTCAKFAKIARREGWPQAEFFAGIPGTMGGAIRMNAGAFGGVTSDHIIACDVLTQDGDIERIDAKTLTWGYRHMSGLGQAPIVRGIFHFTQTTQQDSLSIEALLAKRQATQPIGTRNCGSVFKNPPGYFAAALIEQVGLKGYQLGQVKVSDKHANFIEHLGQGSSDSVRDLMAMIQQTVYDKHGIWLEPEVHDLGEK